MEKNVLKPLTSLRFFAAFGVFLTHQDFWEKSSGLSVFYRNFMLNDGAFGVTFFFILSGFILYYNYAKSFQTLDRREFMQFYINRFARIYPVHVLAFVVVLPFFLKAIIHEPVSHLPKALLNLFLLQAWIPKVDVYFSINSPSWSISNEFFFYAVFPFAVWVIHKARGLRWKTSVTWIAGIWLYIIIVSTIVSQSMENWVLFIFPLMRLLDFLVGIVLASIYLEVKSQVETKKSGAAIYQILEVIAITIVVMSVYESSHSSTALLKTAYWYPSSILLIYIFALGKGWFSKALSIWWLVFLGEVSFSLYMLHLPVQRYLGYIHLLQGIHPVILSCINFIAALTASVVVHVLYEKQMRVRVKQFGNKLISARTVLIQNNHYTG